MRDTLVITPELFATEGGISRIMRLYVRALADGAGVGDKLRVVALNDVPGTMLRTREIAPNKVAGGYNAARRKVRFALAAIRLGLGSGRIVCGHVHLLILARIVRLLQPSTEYYLVAHGIEVWRPFSIAERWALRSATRIFCVSHYTRDQVLRFAPELDSGRLIVIPNTVDPRFDGRRDDQRDLLADKRTPPLPGGSQPRILVVSRLDAVDSYKGVDTMIEAMPAILAAFPYAQLRIVGKGDDLGRLKVLAKNTGAAHAIHFTGFIEDTVLVEEYQACDLFALPSRREGFGLVYLEVMNYGKPCLAARAGGAPEVVNNDVGCLVEYGNVEQIGVAVVDLLKHGRNPAAIQQRARDFSFAIFVRRLSDALCGPTSA